MDIETLKYKEQVLRNIFKNKLMDLDVEGYNSYETVKCIKTFGALWHYTHQLLMAEEKSEFSADTLDMRATGLKMNKQG